jgi:hypothetical protein
VAGCGECGGEPPGSGATELVINAVEVGILEYRKYSATDVL